MFTPKGLSVRSRIFTISARTASSSPEDVSMMPRPPASDTAAEGGFTCLRARASDLERDFAYGCVRQLLEPAVAQLSGSERESAFEGTAAFAKSLFAPPAALAEGAPPGAEPASSDLSFSMLHGLYWLVNNLAAEEPVALVVDDLHWADPETLRFLVYLAPRLDVRAMPTSWRG